MPRVKLPHPDRPRRYTFSLTPLADAMFQLLIFFMLASNLSPYSLITLQAASIGTSQISGGATDEAGPLPTGDVAVWTLGRSRISTGGQDFPLEDLDLLAQAAAEAQVPTVVLLTSPGSSVQDMASALAALTRAEIPIVQIADSGRVR